MSVTVGLSWKVLLLGMGVYACAVALLNCANPVVGLRMKDVVVDRKQASFEKRKVLRTFNKAYTAREKAVWMIRTRSPEILTSTDWQEIDAAPSGSRLPMIYQKLKKSSSDAEESAADSELKTMW